jgi:hypothetical protein
MALSEEVRTDAVMKLRQAADLLEAGQEKECGTLILDGLGPVARDLKRTWGPVVNLMVRAWMTKLLNDGTSTK